MSTSVLMELDARLDSLDTVAVRAAAWDVFDMATGLCDRITFDEDSDELQTMVAAQQCSEGRDRLPLPESGRPVAAQAPEPGAAGLVPYVRLLEHVGDALARLSAAADDETARSLTQVRELASGAAAALTRVWEQ
ncbi:hypothetical protein ACFW6F_38895 [Streptomyces sp. NPDC058746]|uniref:hypothetical protein n=1 Tax=Streptomyces sp. NPDC058746 TaxID=3346622 RepID=UPI0036BC2DEA